MGPSDGGGPLTCPDRHRAGHRRVEHGDVRACDRAARPALPRRPALPVGAARIRDRLGSCRGRRILVRQGHPGDRAAEVEEDCRQCGRRDIRVGQAAQALVQAGGDEVLHLERLRRPERASAARCGGRPGRAAAGAAAAGPGRGRLRDERGGHLLPAQAPVVDDPRAGGSAGRGPRRVAVARRGPDGAGGQRRRGLRRRGPHADARARRPRQSEGGSLAGRQCGVVRLVGGPALECVFAGGVPVEHARGDVARRSCGGHCSRRHRGAVRRGSTHRVDVRQEFEQLGQFCTDGETGTHRVLGRAPRRSRGDPAGCHRRLGACSFPAGPAQHRGGPGARLGRGSIPLAEFLLTAPACMAVGFRG
mmetsp:Transcript_99196/g.303311  ORF Transcript_99196/g.303311 Transcript_99196/m.303311 type:complete len:362 (+) Transcript_99196:1382-2467(+)